MVLSIFRFFYDSENFVATPWSCTKLVRLMRPMGHSAPRPPYDDYNPLFPESPIHVIALVVPAGVINIVKEL